MKAVSGWILTAVLGCAAGSEEKAPEVPSSEDVASAERKVNDEAYRVRYLPSKEALVRQHAGKWLAIAGGEVIPRDAGGRVAPAGTVEECVAVAERNKVTWGPDETVWERNGKSKSFPVSDVAEMEVTLSDPVGQSPWKIVVTDSGGFSGLALFGPALAEGLGLSRFEIPGVARIEGGERLTCRRALARLKVPEIDADVVIPVAVWSPPAS
jgi:hypothetical protein